MADPVPHHRLRTTAAADYLGYAESTLEKKRLSGEGPVFIKLGRAVVYDTRDLDAWLAARRATSTSEPRTCQPVMANCNTPAGLVEAVEPRSGTPGPHGTSKGPA